MVFSKQKKIQAVKLAIKSHMSPMDSPWLFMSFLSYSSSLAPSMDKNPNHITAKVKN